MSLPPRQPSCPDELRLEAHLLEAVPEITTHAEQCPHCQGYLTVAAETAAVFTAQVAPRVRQALDEARDEALPLGLFRRLIAPLSVVGAAAAVVLAIGLSGPGPGERASPPDLLTKGGGLQVHLRHGEQLLAATEGHSVEPGDALRFTVTPPSGEWVWVVSVDGAGTISRLVPATGEMPLRVKGRTTLPGSAVLDATPGPERVVALFCAEPVPFSEIEAAVRASFPASEEAPGADGIRALALSDLPCAAHATLLLERVGP